MKIHDFWDSLMQILFCHCHKNFYHIFPDLWGYIPKRTKRSFLTATTLIGYYYRHERNIQHQNGTRFNYLYMTTIILHWSSHSVHEKHSTSGLLSGILNYGNRLTSANVDCVTTHQWLGHGEKCRENRWNFGDIPFNSRDTMYFRFKVSRLSSFDVNRPRISMRGRLTSDKVGSVTTDSDMVENVRAAAGILTISHSVPEKHSTSGL